MDIMILQKNITALLKLNDGVEEPGKLKNTLDELKSAKYRHVLLDLLHKEWLSSSEIGSIIWLLKELEEVDTKLYLLAESSFIRKTIQVTGIDKILPIFDSKETALKDIS